MSGQIHNYHRFAYNHSYGNCRDHITLEKFFVHSPPSLVKTRITSPGIHTNRRGILPISTFGVHEK